MGVEFQITAHAARRYIQRIDGELSPEEARSAIRAHSKAIEAALEFGCGCVRMACGGRLIIDLEQQVVVTVHAPQPKIKGRKFHGRRHPSRGTVSIERRKNGGWRYED